MLDIIAAHQNQLPLPVEVVGVNNTQAGLTRPATDGGSQPPSEQQTVEKIDDSNHNDDRGHGRRIG